MASFKPTTLNTKSILIRLLFCIILLPAISIARVTLDCKQLKQDDEFLLTKRWSKSNQIKIDNVEPNSQYIIIISDDFQFGSTIQTSQNMEVVREGNYTILKTHEINTSGNITTVHGITINVSGKSTNKKDSIKLLKVYLSKVNSNDSSTISKQILKEHFN